MREKGINIRLVDCSDSNILYGILTVHGCMTVEEVQDKIIDIKNSDSMFSDSEWSINDVFERFPSEWSWEFVANEDYTVRI